MYRNYMETFQPSCINGEGGSGAPALPERPAPAPFGGGLPPASQKGIYFCEVKGITRRSDGSPQSAAMLKLLGVGERVQLVPDSQNKFDPDALCVLAQNGQQVGCISGRQAARFVDRLHLVTATVYSWDKDEWDRDVLNLHVEESPEPSRVQSPLPSGPLALSTASQARVAARELLDRALALSMPKILLGSLMITCTGVAIVNHSWWPLTVAAGVYLLYQFARLPHT